MRQHPIDNTPPRWNAIIDFILCRQCTGETQADHISSAPEVPVTVPPDVLARQGQLREAKARLAILFSNADNPASRADSQQAIDIYLQNPFETPLPEDVRELLVMLDMAVKNTHEAIPYGRGNVLVRNCDVLPHDAVSDSEGSNTTSKINSGTTISKRYLANLAYGVYQEMATAEYRTMDKLLQSAATSLLTGTAVCSSYTILCGLTVMHRISQSGQCTPKKLELNFMLDPILDGVRIEHGFCEISCLASDGNCYKFILDPWAEMNMPIIKNHSRYMDARKSFSIKTGTTIDVARISSFIDDASGRIESTMGSRRLRKLPQRLQQKLSEADHAQRYSLTNPHNSFVDREQLNMAKEGVILPPSRRPSLVDVSKASLAVIIPS